MNRGLRLLAASLLPMLLLGACGATPGSPSSAPSAAPATPSSSAPERPPASDDSGAIGGEPGAGVTPSPGPSGPRPSFVEPPTTDVVATAGLKNVHDVAAERFTVDGSSGSILVTILWWSGPAPCSQLSTVNVDRKDSPAGSAFTLTVREGAQEANVACPALATHKRTVVDLGPINDGDWTISVTGVDQPQSIQLP